MSESAKRVRHCSNPNCGREITACNGFVKAGDLAELIEHTRRIEDVRELCGVCGARANHADDTGMLESFVKGIGWTP